MPWALVCGGMKNFVFAFIALDVLVGSIYFCVFCFLRCRGTSGAAAINIYINVTLV